VGDDLAVGFAREAAPLRNQLLAKRLEVLDDAVVHQRHRSDDVRMGIADGRRAVCRPARVGDADQAVERMLLQLALQVLELALGPPALELAVIDGADARRIVAAVFQPLQSFEQPACDAARSDNSNNSAHVNLAC